MGWFASAKEFLKNLRGEEDQFKSNFTPRAVQVFALARREAERLHHNYIGTEHVLLGLLKLGTGGVYDVLEKFELMPENLRKEVERLVGAGPIDKSTSSFPFTPRVKKVLAFAREEAKALHHSYVSTEHLLLGLLREGDGIAGLVLKHCGADIERIRSEVLKELNPDATTECQIKEQLPPTVAIPERRIEEQQLAPTEEPANEYDLLEGASRFTPRAEQVLALARKEANRLHLNSLGTEHLLVGLVESGAGVAANALVNEGINLENVRAEVEMLAKGHNEKMSGNVPYTPQLKRVADWASQEAKELNHTFIGTEHLLLGLLRENDGPAASILKKFDVDMEALRQEILSSLNPL